MATVVGEALLCSTVEFLLKSITSGEFRQYFKNRKLNVSLLGELETTLLALQAVLDDAEEKQITNSAVKEWLDKLKDAVFDTEDLLEEIRTDSLRCKLEAKPQNATRKVLNFLSTPFNQFYMEINSKMVEMSERLQSFEKRKDILGLQNASARITRRNPTTSLVNESVVVGRKKDEEKLINLLLSHDNANGNSVGVVTILGMGGVGKTTFAQLLYNNKEVQEHFDLKAWACVSEDFDVIRLIKSLLESVTSRVYDSSNLDYLQVELKRRLRDKKFLFVLDDLWNDKYNDWDDLRTPFSDGKNGSRVIITTRLQRVAEVTHTFPIYKLEPLSDEDCWSLLAKHAFGGEDPNRYPNLEVIGKKIAKKCDGLPIAAKTLGGLLRSKVNLKEWEIILNSNIWDLTSSDILPALHLSYLYLPTHLKRCFAYCSICPKDFPLDRKQLVLCWMAEGFVQESQGEKSMEEIGDDYFVELLSRSLVQQAKGANYYESYVMHDLVHDLARVVSGKSCFRFEYGEIPENVRHLSYDREYYDSSKKFEDFYKLKCLRSFLPLSPRWWVRGYITRKVLDDLIPTLKWLRVLSLSKYKNITRLPNSIGNLVHLRYLNLSHTAIKSLPETTCMLYNLQTLILSECYLLTDLPLHIGKLVNLRHLDISGTKLKMMPMQISGLQNLRTLTTFVVGRQQDGLRVRELRKFPHLYGKLSILNLHNVIDAMDAFEANLKCKEKINELVLGWGKNTEDSRMEKDVLDQLQPSTNLGKLTIESYGGTSFPSWVGDSSFSNLMSLRISNCEYCITLPPLGQLPSLKELSVVGMKLETIGPEFYGKAGGSNSSFQPFPSLEHLKFQDMSNWEEWLPFATDQGSQFPFPHLRSLRLLNCPKLRKHLPHHLPLLTEVEISGCYELQATTSTLHWITSIKRLNIVGGAQWSLLGNDAQCLLQQVRVENCDSLPSLPKMILSSNCLQNLSLHGIPSLASLPASGLPTSLRSLRVAYCKNLTFLPLETWCNYTSLEALEIKNSCHSLTSFPLDCFPALKDLIIRSCTNLQSLSISEPSPWHQSSRLQSLDIHDCKVLRSLPARIDALTALQNLTIKLLPGLESFPQGGLPPNIQSFLVVDCGRLSPRRVAEWGLQRLTSLSRFRIGGDGLVNALLKERLLPASLVSLQISFVSDLKSLEGNGLRHLTSLKKLEIKHCQKLESLLEGEFQHLTALKQLWIRDCPMLESFPDDGLQHLSSLKELNIIDCPRLESLPGDKLPPFLYILTIRKCPLLEAKYQSQRGEHWSKISHIPVIDINSKVTI